MPGVQTCEDWDLKTAKTATGFRAHSVQEAWTKGSCLFEAQSIEDATAGHNRILQYDARKTVFLLHLL